MSKPVVTGVTPATTVAELLAASTAASARAPPASARAPPAPSTTTAAPTTTVPPMGLSTGTVPSTYVQYPTYAGQITARPDISLSGSALFPGTPPSAANKSAAGAGTVRNAYYIATTAAKGATSPPQGSPITTGSLIGWNVVITGGAIPTGSVFRTTIDSYHTMNNMTWDGYRYGTFTFSPEPPAPKGPYKFFFAPTAKGGRRRRGSKRSGPKRRGRKGTRRH
jgi:hypothetical protein